MPPLRPRLPLLAALSAVLTLGIWSCKDKGKGITDPVDEKPVASVSVTPATVAIPAGDTVRFRATVHDADGAELAGRRITWSSSTQSVATVDSTGLATGVAEGQATITASAEGRSATAALGVARAQDPNVVAGGDIGSAGGSVGTAEVGITIPAGGLTGTTKIEILKAEAPIQEFGTSGVTSTYLLRGFPTDRDVDVRVRLKVTGTLSDQSYVGLTVPVISSGADSVEVVPGLLMREARDSAGYLVATVPVRGQGSGASPSAGAQGAPATTGGLPGLLDGMLGGISAVRADTVPGGHFVIVSWGEPRSQLQGKVSRAAKLMEDARVTLLGMGYSVSHRTRWPVEVRVYPIEEGTNGYFAQRLPFPLNPNTGYFGLNAGRMDSPNMPGTAIHEMYHLVQARYTRTMDEALRDSYLWVKEASATWITEKAPETIGVFPNATFRSWREHLFGGFYPAMTASHGYGKASVIKYIADHHGGAEEIRQMWERIGSGMPAIPALFGAIPSAPAVWWPDLLTRYMRGEIIGLVADELPPPGPTLTLRPGYGAYSRTLRPLAASFISFTPTPGAYGTGTTLKMRTNPTLRSAGIKFLPFRIDAAGRRWEAFGTMVDSLDIPGSELNTGRRFGVYMVHTTPTTPYTQTWSGSYIADLGFTDGDWVTSDVSVVQDAITYVRPEGDTNGIDVRANVAEIFTSLASGGAWRRSANAPNRYVWGATEEFAQVLALYNTTATSEAVVRNMSNGVDSLYLRATFDLNPPAAPVGEPGQAAAFGGAALLLLTGVALRRRRRVLMVATLGAVGLGTWGCDLGRISFTAKFTYDFAFASPSLVASAEDATLPLVTLSGGSGTMKVDRYRSEWWKYIRDEQNAIVDSVAQVRTATGTATVALGAALYNDGVITDDDDDGSGVAARASRLFQLPIEAVAGPVRAARPR